MGPPLVRVEPWRPSTSYVVGDRVTWNRARLICTHEHFAGPAANHPWDPGWSWTPERAACLWTPVDKRATKTLLKWAKGREKDRLVQVVLTASGL